MRQWYCMIGGQRYGPVDEQVLRQWIAEGRVGPADLAWCEGMAGWIPVGTLMPEAFAGRPGPQQAQGPGGPQVPPRPAGSGGLTPNAEITARARQLLNGRWGRPMGFCVLLFLLSMAAGMVPYIGGLVQLIVDGAFYLGLAIFFLNFTRVGGGDMNMLFAGFRHFSRALAAYLLMGLFVFLWSLLLIVPGIIAALRYSQTLYLLADDPNLGALEAINVSKQMMIGRKWKLFCLGLRFFGWSLLCLLTCFIGYLWLYPYMHTAYALFYDDLHPPAGAAAQLPGPVNPVLVPAPVPST